MAISDAQRRLAPDLTWAGMVHNGILLEDYNLVADKEDYCLYLGRISRTKGVHVAIDAALASGHRLVIAGAPTIASERDYFEAEVRPRLCERVQWVGEVGGRAKRDLLAGARCLLFPLQWNEPFGLVLLEALACGTPVVSLRAGSVAEVVTDGISGFVCEHPSELPEAIARVSSLRPEACRAAVAGSFTASKMVAGYEDLYRAIVGNGFESDPTSTGTAEGETT